MGDPPPGVRLCRPRLGGDHESELSPGRGDPLPRCLATWNAADGIPIVHFSSQDPLKQPGAHAPWVDPSDYHAFVARTGPGLVDCMLEAKQKDLALLQLRQELAVTDASGSAVVGE